MRMSAGTRVVLTIYLLIIICVFLFVLASMFGLIPSTMLEGVVATAIKGGLWYKVLYAGICVVMIIVSLCLMFFGIKKRVPHESTVNIAQLNGGAIVITTKAVEELIERETSQTSGIRGAHTRVVSHGDFIDVLVHASVSPGENIPELTKNLQAKLQNELQNQTGITVRDMKITVTDIAESMAKANQKAPRVV